jgi:cystathionine beta-lyase/cystathionine gamma-synthase
MNKSYIINHFGEDDVDVENAYPVSNPIFQTSNFYFKTVEKFKEAINDERHNYLYTRGNNPTINLLAKKIAALEKAEASLVFASGMAAISTAVIAFLKAGDHVICVQKPYSWTYKLLSSLLQKFNVSTTFIDGTDLKVFKNALRSNTKLIYLESPSSFTFELQDLHAVANFAKENGLYTIIDNSYSSPMYQNPLEMGIDVVVHSATKYIGGHSDTVAGIVCSSKKIIDKMFDNEFLTLGGIISPFNAWLLLRGLRTLPLRMERIASSTMKIVEYFENHSKVEKVLYPFSKSFPQYELAKKQMKNGGGLFSIILKTNNIKNIENFCNKLQYFYLAPSWGGHESLVIPACIFHENNKQSDIPLNLIRFYIGLEDPEVLIDDINLAIKEIK